MLDADPDPLPDPPSDRVSGPPPEPAPDRSDTAAGAGGAGAGRAVADDPGEIPPTLPSTAARLVAFAAILAAGGAGGFIGYAITDLQCRGDCDLNRGIGMLVGAVIAAVGVAIVVQLALRAMSEWRRIETERAGTSAPGPRVPESPRARPHAPPRVR